MDPTRERLNIMREELDKQVAKLREEVSSSKANSEVSIDQISLDTEMQRQPSYMYYYSSKLASMVALKEAYKVYVDFLKAVVDEEVRIQLSSNPNDKVTEDKVKAAVIRNGQVLDAKLELVRLERDVDLLKSIVDSFIHKKDMLISLASNMRSRLQSEINI